MFREIRKRDGRLMAFDADKITQAIAKAGEATQAFDTPTAQQLMVRVVAIAERLYADGIPEVEQIQNIVEEVLLDSPYRKAAKAYILYREQHARLREWIAQSNVKLVDNYIGRMDWLVRENSNMGYSLQGLHNYITSSVSQTYWMDQIYPAEVRDAHRSGDLHIHDLSHLSVYCVGWDLRDLLLQGFCGVPGKVASKPPRHFRTALGQIANFFYTLQGEAAGAQAFSNFDTLLAPFIREDTLSYSEVKQAMQEFIFNLNVPTRVGFQTPFTNLTFDLHVPSTHAQQPVVIGGELRNSTYADYQTEMDLLNQAFLEVMSTGDAHGRVFTFPIPTYNITADFNWDYAPIAKLWEVTARYGLPYFANFVNSDLSPEDARSMCCRLRLDTRQLEKRGGGLFGANPLTGSIGVVTLNLPRIGYTAHNESGFYTQLDRLLTIAKTSLEIKREILEKLTMKGLYPYSAFYLRGVRERLHGFWGNHFSTIGIIGMNEACTNLLGVGIAHERGHRFALEVMDHIREQLQAFQTETGNFYNLEATPAEGTTYRLARLDVERYPDILHANPGGEPFYTNSTHLPVNATDDIFALFDHQDELQVRYTGGTVVHAFLGECVTDPQTVKDFVRTVCGTYRLPYFTLTPTFSVCPNHGYLVGEQPLCPICEERTEIYSRVVGYLRPVDYWNPGKQAEFKLRATYEATMNAMQPATE